MNRFYGKVGYAETVETGASVYTDSITERPYYGNILSNKSKWQQSSGNVNDNLVLSQKVSIIADAYAYQNYSRIKYVYILGVKWKVTDIEVSRPRLILTTGGEYNG